MRGVWLVVTCSRRACSARRAGTRHTTRDRWANRRHHARQHRVRYANVSAMLGVRVAPNGLSLFATTTGLPTMIGYSANDSSVAAILQMHIVDGAIERRWDVTPDGERRLLGDVAIAADGTVYASDSYAPNLLRIRPGASTLGLDGILWSRGTVIGGSMTTRMHGVRERRCSQRV